jgi:hypothetical protein
LGSFSTELGSSCHVRYAPDSDRAADIHVRQLRARAQSRCAPARCAGGANIEHYRRLIAESALDLSRDEDQNTADTTWRGIGQGQKAAQRCMSLLLAHRFVAAQPFRCTADMVRLAAGTIRSRMSGQGNLVRWVTLRRVHESAVAARDDGRGRTAPGTGLLLTLVA